MKHPDPIDKTATDADICFDENSNEIRQRRANYQVNRGKLATPIANIDEQILEPDIRQELAHLQQQYQQAQKQLLSRHKQKVQHQQVDNLLDSLNTFDDKNAVTRLELIRRYSVLRQQVKNKTEFVNAKQLATILNENKTNWSRDLANLYKKGKLLAVRSLGSNNWEYPINQIDPNQGAVYPALEQMIGKFKLQGLNDWDILIWLNLPSIDIEVVNPVELSQQDSLETLISDFEKRQIPEPLTHYLPIDLLQQGDVKQFNHLANQFLDQHTSG